MSNTLGGGQSLPKTGYITAEGKDLAEVFLGKQEKAASAATADTATSAEEAKTVVWEDITNIPVLAPTLDFDNKITNTSQSWTVPKAGMLICRGSNPYVDETGSITVGGITFRANEKDKPCTFTCLVNAGTQYSRGLFRSSELILVPFK